MKKSLIIFDLDGTLIDSVPDLAVAVGDMLTELGPDTPSIDNVRTWVGNGSRMLTKRALAWADLPCDDGFLEQAHERFLAAYGRSTCQQTVEYAGVTAGLNELIGAGFTLAMATNKPARFVPEILANMGWADKFAVILGGDSLPTKKPDPMPLHHICDTLGISPDGAIMVGDSVNDVQAGKNAGMTTLALTYGYNYDKPISESEPDGVFDEFGALVAFILKEYS